MTALPAKLAPLFFVARALAVQAYPYLVRALFALEPVAVPGLGTFACDASWRVYMDPVCLQLWRPSVVAGTLVHEAWHLLLDHAERRVASCGSDDGHHWNLAADAEINDGLVEDMRLELPEGIVTPATLGAPAHHTAEVYMGLLRSRSRPLPVRSGQGGCGSGADGRQRPWDLSGAGDAAGSRSERGGVSRVEAARIRHGTAAAILAASGDAGTIGDSWVTWAAALASPTATDWRQVLHAALRSTLRVRAGSGMSSYQRLRRRPPVDSSLILPGTVRRVLDSVAVLVDTSGSMTPSREAAMAEVAGICASVAADRYLVVACDVAVRDVHLLAPGQALPQFHGGGGTDLRVGLDMLAARQPRPDVVVVVTDAMTPWPQTPPPFPVLVAQVTAPGDFDVPAPPPWSRSITVSGEAP